jgi:hypothetical protein
MGQGDSDAQQPDVELGVGGKDGQQQAPKKDNGPSTAIVAGTVAFYFVISVSLVFLNKAVSSLFFFVSPPLPPVLCFVLCDSLLFPSRRPLSVFYF